MPFVRIVTDVTYDFPVFVDNKNPDKPIYREAVTGDAPEDTLTFTMKRMTNEQTSEIDDKTMVTKGKRTHYLVGTARVQALKWCVAGWSGMTQENGEEIVFNHANLNGLPGALIKVIQAHIIDVNGLREDEEKN